MNRKDFIKRSALGMVGGLAAGKLVASSLSLPSAADETLGFNHLPPIPSKIMENMVLHRAGTRGHANHGWLDSHHSFSFASYHNPERMHFGVLRVLNDDQVDAGQGFGTHPHNNMEIISIPLEGDLEHKDSMGNTAVIREGDVQVLSAGTGIQHSEYNKNRDKKVKFLQIWLFPNKKDVKPRYDQMSFKLEDRNNKFQQVLSPNADDEGVWIHQDAWFHLGKFDAGKVAEYKLKKEGNGMYVFVLKGKLSAAGQELNKRDGMGLWDSDSLSLTAIENSEVLLMEVPMELN